MARRVEKLPPHGNTGRQKYPWSDWLNGDPWLIERDDFNGASISNFRTQVYNQAAKHGVSVRTRTKSDGLYIQAFKDGDNG